MVGFWLSTEPALAEGGERNVFKKLRRPGSEFLNHRMATED